MHRWFGEKTYLTFTTSEGSVHTNSWLQEAIPRTGSMRRMGGSDRLPASTVLNILAPAVETKFKHTTEGTADEQIRLHDGREGRHRPPNASRGYTSRLQSDMVPHGGSDRLPAGTVLNSHSSEPCQGVSDKPL